MVRIPTLRKETLAVTTLILSMVCHAMVYVLIAKELEPGGLDFANELAAFLLLSLIASVAVFLVNDQRYFRVIQGMRGAFVLVILRIVAARSTATSLLLLLPLIGELGIYERPLVAVPTSALYVAINLALDALTTASADPVRLLMISIGTGTAIYLFTLVTHYRERVVADEGTIATLTRAFENLSDANLGLQLYATHAESDSAKKERNRITRELHDSIGYALTSVTMMMNAAKVLMNTDPKGLEELLDSTRNLSDECLQETRKILYQLRSIRDSRIRGIRALSGLITAFRTATGMEVEFHHGNVPWTLGEDTDAVLYRLVQVGLTNAFRHGQATQIRIYLWKDESAVRIRIWDNGLGAANIQEGIGLSGMRERVGALGGRLEPRNTVDGFELRAEIPTGRMSE